MVSTWPMRARQALFAISSRLTLAHFAALTMIAASCVANFRYGWNLGTDDLDRSIAGLASIGVEAWNAVALLAIAAMWRSGRRVQAAMGSFVLVLTIMYALQAGLGFATGVRDTTLASRDTAIRAAKFEITERDRIQSEIQSLGPQLPPDVYRAQIETILADPRAEGCATINGPYTREHCPKLAGLRTNLAKAIRYEQLNYALSSIKSVSPSVGSSVSPLNDTLRLLGRFEATDETLTAYQSVLFTIIIVLGGPIALWIAENNVHRPSVSVPVPSVELSSSKIIEPVRVTTPPKPPKKKRPRSTKTERALRLVHSGPISGRNHSDIVKQLGISRGMYDKLRRDSRIRVDQTGDGLLAVAA